MMPPGFFEGVWFLISKHWFVFAMGVFTTLFIAISGTLIGIMLALPLVALRVLPKQPMDTKIYRFFRNIMSGFSKVYIQVFRGTPMIVQATVIYYGVIYFAGYWPAFIAGIAVVGLNTTAYIAEILRGSIQAIEKGQAEAGLSLGMSYSQMMIRVVFPQALKNSLPAFGNEIIVNIKDTAVLSVIAVSDLFYSSRFLTTTYYRQFEVYFIVSILYLMMTLSFSALLKSIERKLHVVNRVSTPTSQTTLEVVDIGDGPGHH
jgi:putative lysine transport system permease protein